MDFPASLSMQTLSIGIGGMRQASYLVCPGTCMASAQSDERDVLFSTTPQPRVVHHTYSHTRTRTIHIPTDPVDESPCQACQEILRGCEASPVDWITLLSESPNQQGHAFNNAQRSHRLAYPIVQQ